MAKKLLIDMTKCDECEKCTVECSYMYKPQITEHGILALREQAAFMLACRRCEEPSCVAACRFEAIERQDDGVLKRYNMRCVGCKSCAQACPFGTIYPETVPFYAARCDYCFGDGKPACVANCVKNAVEYKDVKESPEDDIYVVSENLAVRSPKWEKKAV